VTFHEREYLSIKWVAHKVKGLSALLTTLTQDQLLLMDALRAIDVTAMAQIS
jgi:hypothetical protein